MKEFVTAALEDVEEQDQVTLPDTLTVKYDGREVTFVKPTTGQLALMMTMGSQDLNIEQLGNFISLFLAICDDETRRYFSGRLLDRNDKFSDSFIEEGGIFELWEFVVKEWSARPIKKPSDYARPQRSTGRKSTAGTTRAPARVSSASRSRGSSQS